MERLLRSKQGAKTSSWGLPGLGNLLRRTWASREEGERQLGLSNFAEAEKHLSQAVSEAECRSAPRKAHIEVLLNLAEAQRRQKKFTDARETIEAALGLLPADQSKTASERAICLELLGNLSLDGADAAAAKDLFRQAILIEESLRKPDEAALAQRLRRLAQAQREAGELEDARATLAKALGLAEVSLGGDDAAVADMLVEMAVLHQAQKDYDAGSACLERALAIHRERCGEDCEEVARDYQRLGALWQEACRYDKAVLYYERALYVRDRQVGADGVEQTLVKVSLAEIHAGLGEYASALELMQQAVLRLDVLQDDRLARSLETLGALYSVCGRPQDASASLHRARDVWERLPGDHEAELEAISGALSQVGMYLPQDKAPHISTPLFREPLVEQRSPASAGVPAARPDTAGSGLPQVGKVLEMPCGYGAPGETLVLVNAGAPVLVPQLLVPRGLHGWEELDCDLVHLD